MPSSGWTGFRAASLTPEPVVDPDRRGTLLPDKQQSAGISEELESRPAQPAHSAAGGVSRAWPEGQAALRLVDVITVS